MLDFFYFDILNYVNKYPNFEPFLYSWSNSHGAVVLGSICLYFI